MKIVVQSVKQHLNFNGRACSFLNLISKVMIRVRIDEYYMQILRKCTQSKIVLIFYAKLQQTAYSKSAQLLQQ